MKKLTLITSLLILALTFAGCSTASSTNAQGSGNNNGSGNNSFTSRPPSAQMQLAIGTLKLDGTPQAVDAKLAGQLLPLWQLLKQLSSSSSTATEEVTAVTDAIQSTMTKTQLSAIQNMNITQRDAFAILQERGALPAGSFQGAGQNGTADNNTNRTGNGTQTSGNRQNGFGGGGFPGGGGFGFNPGGNGQQNSNSQRTQTGNRTNRFSGLLIDEIIKLLESKIKS